ENGNGKTNILEAIHFLAVKKSFRKNTAFPQLLSADGEKPEIILSALFEKDGKNFTLSGRLHSEGIDWSLDGKPVKRRELLPAVFVNPMDSFSFHQNASFRRAWFDDHFSLIDPNYRTLLGKVQKALRFRNTLLSKRPSQFQAQIQASDPAFAAMSLELLKLRKFHLSELVKPLNEIFRS